LDLEIGDWRLKSGFRWVRPPSELGKAIEKYGEGVLVAVHAAAARVGLQMQDDGRLSVPWQDRTGNARSGLFFAVDGFGLGTVMGSVKPEALADKSDTVTVSGDREHLILTFGHTVYYGKYLELAHGGRYAIVMSTIERNLPTLERLLNEAVQKGRI
jgi:hypothetical protein